MDPDTYPPECCLFGDDREESAHIIRECPALVQSRIKCLRAPILEEWFLSGSLSFTKLPKVAALQDEDRPDIPFVDSDADNHLDNNDQPER
jgi:hypothetical protein